MESDRDKGAVKHFSQRFPRGCCLQLWSNQCELRSKTVTGPVHSSSERRGRREKREREKSVLSPDKSLWFQNPWNSACSLVTDVTSHCLSFSFLSSRLDIWQSLIYSLSNFSHVGSEIQFCVAVKRSVLGTYCRARLAVSVTRFGRFPSQLGLGQCGIQVLAPALLGRTIWRKSLEKIFGPLLLTYLQFGNLSHSPGDLWDNRGDHSEEDVGGGRNTELKAWSQSSVETFSLSLSLFSLCWTVNTEYSMCESVMGLTSAS